MMTYDWQVYTKAFRGNLEFFCRKSERLLQISAALALIEHLKNRLTMNPSTEMISTIVSPVSLLNPAISIALREKYN